MFASHLPATKKINKLVTCSKATVVTRRFDLAAVMDVTRAAAATSQK